MIETKKDLYLKHLIQRKENGAIKVITGVKRCGKSYLLFQRTMIKNIMFFWMKCSFVMDLKAF